MTPLRTTNAERTSSTTTMQSMNRPGGARSGAVLILVAGFSALLATLALAFLTRMRTDSEESQQLLQQAQARLMLAAACNYIQETSRIGWDQYPAASKPGPNPGFKSSYIAAYDSSQPFPGDVNSGTQVRVHEETLGWTDVRDGSPGPTTQEGRVCYDPTKAVVWWADSPTLRPLWPAPTAVVRCPMFVWKRPPCATQLTACYNPIITAPSQSSNPAYLYPFLSNPDPQPQVSNGWTPGSATVSNTLFDDGKNGASLTDFLHGDPTPRLQTVGTSWFRILREGTATFLITVGAGGTYGFKSYSEAVNQSQTALFNNDPAFFQSLANSELRCWYRIEWSAAVTDVTYHWNLHHTLGAQDNYTQWPQNCSHSWTYGPRSSGFDRNMGGTIRWIERLAMEPTSW